MFESHFYNETIRNVVTAFGTLFNNINIQKLDADGNEVSKIRVPLAYSTREKFIQRLREDDRLDDEEYPNAHVQMTLPRMSFSMGSMSYDPTRKRNTTHRRRIKDTQNTQNFLTYQYAEVPYNFGFELGVYAGSFNDGLQIVEQILPYFTPEFNLTFQRSGGTSDLYTKMDVPIVLDSVNLEYDALGDMETRRLLIWNMSFTAKYYLHGPTKREKTITSSDVTLFQLDGFTSGQISGSTGTDEQRSATGPSGDLTGLTGAVSRIIVGPSGPTADISNYDFNVDKYVLWTDTNSIDTTGVTS